MASSVDICNMALGHLGAKAVVSAINPPDGSTEANWCSRFYPQSVRRALEMHDWAFARKRSALGVLATNDSEVWTYAYSLPSDCFVPRRILTDLATAYEEDSENFKREGVVLYSNKAASVLVYTFDQQDTTKFSAAFTDLASYLLAGYLAGPIIKGVDGATTAAKMRAAAAEVLKEAEKVDAQSTDVPNDFTPGSIGARNGSN